MTRNPTDREHHFLHELDKQLASTADGQPVTARDVGQAIDFDDRECVDALAGLFGLDLVKQSGANGEAGFGDPYTLDGLDITWRGTLFLRNSSAVFE